MKICTKVNLEFLKIFEFTIGSNIFYGSWGQILLEKLNIVQVSFEKYSSIFGLYLVRMSN